ncbi:inorganic pyrophosphatase [Clostridia bacterium]|nr:inorganic pyrophosphatase [Clostridia bacterium]
MNTQELQKLIGTTVTVEVDRPLGSVHPNHTDVIYSVNYGYIKGIIAQDGEEQDVYILGVTAPVNCFTGVVINVIHRKNDIEDKLVVAPKNVRFTKDEIIKATHFQEKYFDIEII